MCVCMFVIGVVCVLCLSSEYFVCPVFVCACCMFSVCMFVYLLVLYYLCVLCPRLVC